MSHVVAIIDQSTFGAYRDAESAPAGSVIFHSPEELARVLPLHSMDNIREKLLEENVESSSSRDEAARRLWLVLSVGVNFDFDWSHEVRKDSFGGRKILDTSKIELIQLMWVRGKDPLVDTFYKKLPKQARQVVDMLVDDGRKVWTNEQADAVILDRGDEIETRMGASAVFHCYKPVLAARKILRRISYLDFATRPEFAGMTLLDKELLE